MKNNLEMTLQRSNQKDCIKASRNMSLLLGIMLLNFSRNLILVFYTGFDTNKLIRFTRILNKPVMTAI